MMVVEEGAGSCIHGPSGRASGSCWYMEEGPATDGSCRGAEYLGAGSDGRLLKIDLDDGMAGRALTFWMLATADR
jgi:hypothetical protein